MSLCYSSMSRHSSEPPPRKPDLRHTHLGEKLCSCIQNLMQQPQCLQINSQTPDHQAL